MTRSTQRRQRQAAVRALAWAALLIGLAAAAVVYQQPVAAWIAVAGTAVCFREAVVACARSDEEEF